MAVSAASIGISVAASLLTAGATYLLTPTQKISNNRVLDISAPNSQYGSSLPWCWGKVRVGGTLIAAAPLKEYKKKKKQGKGTKVETTTYKYGGTFGVMFAECPFRPAIEYRRLWLNKQLKYASYGDEYTLYESNRFKNANLEFYLGTEGQQPDPVLEAISNISGDGIPNDATERAAFLQALGLDPFSTITTPGYIKRAYMSVNNMELTDFNNTIPGFEAEIDFGAGNLGQIIKDLFGLYYDQNDLYTTPIDSINVDGFWINSESQAKNAIQSLQRAYHFDIVQSGRLIKFIPLKSSRPVNLISPDELAAHQQGKARPQNFEIVETDIKQLPTEYAVSFKDKNKDQDNNKVYSRVQSKPNENKITVDLPLVLTATEAQNISDRLLYLAWLERYKYQFSLPPKYLALEPTDLIQNIFDDFPGSIKLTQSRIGANFIMQCEGVRHDASIFDFERTIDDGATNLETASYTVAIAVSGQVYGVTGTNGTTYTEGTDYTVSNNEVNILSTGAIAEGEQIYISQAQPATESTSNTPTITNVGDTTLKILDIPLITDSDSDWTIYLTGGGGDNWTEASIYYSTDNINYQFVALLDTYGVYGTGSINNTGNEITVTVNAQELSSVSDADIEAGLNKALIGNRIFQFKTATLTNANTYVLTDLVTDLRGTTWQTNTTDEQFVLLTGENAYLEKITSSITDHNQTRYFKALSPGQALDDVVSQSITVASNAQKPYSPINLTATKDEVGNIRFSWDRRDRHAGERSDIQNFPLSETREEYSLVVLNGTSEVRNIVSYKSDASYTATEQIADFGSLQTTITVKLAQVSAEVGAGNYLEATVTPAFNPAVPTITSFDPQAVQIGDTITVYGSGLAGVTAATVNGTPVTNLAVVSDSEANFVVASGTTTGFIQLTTPGGSTSSNTALIIDGDYLERDTYTDTTSGLIKQSVVAFPAPKDITLPYTIAPADLGLELIVASGTGIVLIPDLATGFADGWGCYLSLDGTGSITIERESGGTTGLLIHNQLSTPGTIIIRHRGNNVWVIS